MIVGCYTMDLYCNFCVHSTVPGTIFEGETFTGPTERSCRRKARAAGWRFHPGDRVECPTCVKARGRGRPSSRRPLPEGGE